MDGSRQSFLVLATQSVFKGALRKSQIGCAFGSTCGTSVSSALIFRSSMLDEELMTAEQTKTAIQWASALSVV
jgi:hypothetical protein